MKEGAIALELRPKGPEKYSFVPSLLLIFAT
jgi:hypothetical protein